MPEIPCSNPHIRYSIVDICQIWSVWQEDEKKLRRVGIIPEYRGFTPDGLASGDVIDMTVDELEVLRLCDLEGLINRPSHSTWASPVPPWRLSAAVHIARWQTRWSMDGRSASKRQHRVLPPYHDDGRIQQRRSTP